MLCRLSSDVLACKIVPHAWKYILKLHIFVFNRDVSHILFYDKRLCVENIINVSLFYGRCRNANCMFNI